MQIKCAPNYYPPYAFTNVGISPFCLQTLDSYEVQAQCQVLKQKISQFNSIKQYSQTQTVLLQIAHNYIIERTPNRSHILSAFECDYQTNFQIIRLSTNIPDKVGQPIGIKFLFKQHSDQTVEFSIQHTMRSNLQLFTQILSCKFIVQLGFHSLFKPTKKIGKGMTACVYNALNLLTGKDVAIKSFKRSIYFAQDNNNGKRAFLKEFKMLTQVKHNNICQLEGVFQTQNSTYIVLELYPLSLYGHIQRHGFPNLQQSKKIIIQLLQAIAYLHDKGIMHRDLKLQNIMVTKDNLDNMRIVLIDLGLAEYVNSQKYLYIRCGTPGYVAPEVLRVKSSDSVQTYSSICDVFSLGVILHILLFKKPVFEDSDPKQVIKKNRECIIDFENVYMKELSPEGIDLLKKMLKKDPSQRISARDALSHPFLLPRNPQLHLQTQKIEPKQY